MNSQHVLPEKFINRLYTTRTSNSLKSVPHILYNPRQQVSSIRTAWIRYHQHGRANISTTKSEQLLRTLSEEGLDIWTLNTTNLFPESLSLREISCFDFILLEYSGPHHCIEAIILQLRKAIPQDHPPPLVILADEPLSKHSVGLIEKGADAFFLTTTDNEVILARCQALLRRCYEVI